MACTPKRTLPLSLDNRSERVCTKLPLAAVSLASSTKAVLSALAVSTSKAWLPLTSTFTPSAAAISLRSLVAMFASTCSALALPPEPSPLTVRSLPTTL